MRNVRSVMLASALAGSAIAYAAPKDQGSKAAAEASPILADGITGNALLAELAASPTGEIMMTQPQAAEGIAAGYLTADESRAADGRAPVKLTDAGFAAFQAAEASKTTSARSSGYEIDDDVPMPADISKRRGGRGGGYPFDALEVGKSFHVPVTAKMPKPWESLTSTVSGARAKYAEETGETKNVEVHTYQKGADGKTVKDADGKRVIASTATEARPVTRLTRDFKVVQVADSDPRGPGARVYRTA